jgi:short chain dehydrogenase
MPGIRSASVLSGSGVAAPDTTSSPCAPGSHSPKRQGLPVAGSRLNSTPVPDPGSAESPATGKAAVSNLCGLDNKIAVITGAAGSIGREPVRVFQERGATVVGVDIQGDCDADLFLMADLTSEHAVRDLYAQAAKAYGKIDILFNNAGVALPDDGWHHRRLRDRRGRPGALNDHEMHV